MKLQIFAVIMMLALTCLAPIAMAVEPVTPTPLPTGTTVPIPTLTPSSYIWWTDTKGKNITSATEGDTVYFQFQTKDDGNTSHYNYYTILKYRQVAQTGAWLYDPLMYPAYSTRMVNNGTYFNFTAHGIQDINIWYQANQNLSKQSSYYYPFYHAQAGTVCNMLFGNPLPPFGGTYHQWRGYGAFVIPDTTDTHYRVSLVSYDFPGQWYAPFCNNYTMIYNLDGQATLQINQKAEPFAFSQWLYDFGGDGLKYLVGAFIIVIMALLPFLIMRQFNVYITIIMIVFAIGINFALGLFGIAIVFALAIGSVAIYILVSKGGGQ